MKLTFFFGGTYVRVQVFSLMTLNKTSTLTSVTVRALQDILNTATSRLIPTVEILLAQRIGSVFSTRLPPVQVTIHLFFVNVILLLQSYV